MSKIIYNVNHFKPALRHVDDALKRQIIGWVGGDLEIGQRIADFLALVKARAADNAVVEAERDEPLFNSRIWNEARTRMAMELRSSPRR